MASVMTSRRSVVRPVAYAMVWVGLGPRVLVTASQITQLIGARQASQTSALSRMRSLRFMGSRLVELAESAGLAELAVQAMLAMLAELERTTLLVPIFF